MDVLDLASAVGVLTGAVGGVASVAALVVRPVRRIDSRLHALEDGQERLAGEMRPNHGGSLRDAIDRTNGAVDTLTQRFADHLDYHRGGGG